MKYNLFALAVASFALIASVECRAQSSAGTISYQGKIAGVSESTMNLIFQFWDSSTGGNAVGAPIVLTGVQIHNGIFSVNLPVDTFGFTGADRWLGVRVDSGAELSPRTKVTSVPYAIRASALVPATNATVDFRADGAGTVGLSATGVAINYTTAPGLLDILHVYNDGVDQPNPIFRVTNQSTVHASSLQLASRTAGRPHLLSCISEFSGDLKGPAAQFDIVDNSIVEGSTGIAINYKNGADDFDLLRGYNHANGGIYSPVFRVSNGGHTTTRVLTITGGSDIAEPYDVSRTDGADPKPGMVVSIDPENVGKLRLASEAYDRKVAGVISGANGLSPGLVLSAQGNPFADGKHPVAMSGRVWVWCDAREERIQPGDRLVTSNMAGYAMKAGDETRAVNCSIGKAMTELSGGQGLVLVLVNVR